MAEKNSHFAKRLISALESANMAKGVLAEKTGIRPQSMAKYTKHGGVPEWHILVRFAELLGVSTDWLLTGKGPGPAGAPGDEQPGPVLQDALIPVFNPELLAGRLIAARELVGRSRKNVNMALQAENHAPVDFEDLCAHIERGLLKSLAGLYGLDDSELISWAYEEPIAASPPVEVEAARIGYRLRRMRGDWSPEQLSQKSGVYLEHVLWYESGIAEPNPDFAGLLAGALGCKPEDISGHGPMPAGLPIRDQAAVKMQGQSQPGHVQVRLPRGDPGPATHRQLDILERALVVLRCPPQQGNWAEVLEKNVTMFHEGVQLSADKLAGMAGDKGGKHIKKIS